MGDEKNPWGLPKMERFPMGFTMIYPLVMTDSLLLKMAIEIVDLPIKNGDFP